MSNTDLLANFGLFILSIFGFAIVTVGVGCAITDFSSDDVFTASWIVGCIVFGITIVVMR